MRAAEVDILADRWTPYYNTVSFIGFDFTGASFAMQVRTTRDATGAPLLNLVTTASATAEGIRILYTGSDTIANHIAAGRLAEVPDGMLTTDIVVLTQLSIRINETSMEALPPAAERGDDLDLFYDMQITPSGGIKQVYLAGKFVVLAGVTQ